MNPRRLRHPSSQKRRVTLTLPSESLLTAQRIARKRKVNLSIVIAEAVEEGLRSKRAAARADRILKSYRKAFAGFTGKEMLALDGVILEKRVP